MRFALLSLLCCLSFSLLAQTSLEVDPKDLSPGGGTHSLGNNCFRLTTAQVWEAGSVWYAPQCDLKEAFEMEMKVLFGCKDEEGADGIVFIFHPQKIPSGYKGEGMGFGGLTPSLGIEIDTYQNYHLMDPEEDHVALMQDGVVHHYESLKGPITLGNVEDCEEHILRINWEPSNYLLSIMLDGETVLTHNINLIRDVFEGQSKVYWGLTAATGKKTNLQEICFQQLSFNEPQLGFSAKRDLLEGAVVDLKKIKFPKGAAQINSQTDKELEKLAKFLLANPKHALTLYTHSNEGSNEDSDMQRSTQRAEALKKRLINLGIDADRINTQAMGRKYADQTKALTRMGNWVNAHVHIPRA